MDVQTVTLQRYRALLKMNTCTAKWFGVQSTGLGTNGGRGGDLGGARSSWTKCLIPSFTGQLPGVNASTELGVPCCFLNLHWHRRSERTDPPTTTESTMANRRTEIKNSHEATASSPTSFFPPFYNLVDPIQQSEWTVKNNHIWHLARSLALSLRLSVLKSLSTRQRHVSPKSHSQTNHLKKQFIFWMFFTTKKTSFTPSVKTSVSQKNSRLTWSLVATTRKQTGGSNKVTQQNRHTRAQSKASLSH